MCAPPTSASVEEEDHEEEEEDHLHSQHFTTADAMQHCT